MDLTSGEYTSEYSPATKMRHLMGHVSPLQRVVYSSFCLKGGQAALPLGLTRPHPTNSSFSPAVDFPESREFSAWEYTRLLRRSGGGIWFLIGQEWCLTHHHSPPVSHVVPCMEEIIERTEHLCIQNQTFPFLPQLAHKLSIQIYPVYLHV